MLLRILSGLLFAFVTLSSCSNKNISNREETRTDTVIYNDIDKYSSIFPLKFINTDCFDTSNIKYAKIFIADTSIFNRRTINKTYGTIGAAFVDNNGIPDHKPSKILKLNNSQLHELYSIFKDSTYNADGIVDACSIEFRHDSPYMILYICTSCNDFDFYPKYFKDCYSGFRSSIKAAEIFSFLNRNNVPVFNSSNELSKSGIEDWIKYKADTNNLKKLYGQ